MDSASSGVVRDETISGKQILPEVGLGSGLVHSAGGERGRLRIQSHDGPFVEEVQKSGCRIGKVRLYRYTITARDDREMIMRVLSRGRDILPQ